MSGNGGPGDTQSLPERFFQAARRVLVKDTDRLVFDAADILRIAGDSAMQAEFREIFRTEVNNPQLADIIGHHLDDLASDLESAAKVSDFKVDLLDRAGIAVAVSAVAAAIGIVVVSGGTLASVALLAGGLVGLSGAGAGRMWMKLNGHRSMLAAAKVRRLANGLEVKR